MGNRQYREDDTPTVIKQLAVTLAIGGVGTVWSATAGKKIRLMGLTIGSDGAGSLYFRDNAINISALYVTPNSSSIILDFADGILLNGSLQVFNNGITGSFWITAWGVEE